ncbi:membrane protein insertion efficiency factor YidD [Brevibacterium sp. NPDC049920]|uniref:Membrane protein insertion efficiency factor YidD n=1 Tax=Brevibacterium pityocampae TaxID=506594 RepID=A0ABP8JBA2_9MICO
MSNTRPITRAPRFGADRAIRMYQRHISPRKGFTCASLVAGAERSCSAVIRSIIAERGVIGGIRPSMSQFARCSRAATSLKAGGGNVQGVCCLGGIPIPFRF